MKLTRRKLLVGGSLAAAGALVLRPGDLGVKYHDEYFSALSQSLDQTEAAKPTLVVDKQRLDANIKTVRQHVDGRFEYRIVAKSLPSVPMLQYIMEQADTRKLMVFHQPFLTQVSQAIPDADVLLGKPMPVKAAQAFYESTRHESFNDEDQLQWLIDSPQRLGQYRDLAASLQRRLNINIELDVGLHRGGVQSDADFLAMLEMIEGNEFLKLSGLMGYEPHIGKVPGDALDHRDQAMETYQHFVDLAEKTLKRSIQDLCLNAAGSPTYQFYSEGKASDYPMNELSSGSCLVKPSDFDLDSLADHIPASFIATPVLKIKQQTEIPGVTGLGKIMSLWNQNWEKTFFVYGGYWKAIPESPKGLTLNPVYGRSSNQEMLNGSASIQLKQDDWVFWRPTQSEAVFLQFGDILLYDQGKISERWRILVG